MNDSTAGRWRVTSAARLVAFDLLNDASPITERRLAAVVDGAACLLTHGGHRESARLLLETVAPQVAGRALHTLLGDDVT
jgi:hypothetical protein